MNINSITFLSEEFRITQYIIDGLNMYVIIACSESDEKIYTKHKKISKLFVSGSKHELCSLLLVLFIYFMKLKETTLCNCNGWAIL